MDEDDFTDMSLVHENPTIHGIVMNQYTKGTIGDRGKAIIYYLDGRKQSIEL